MFEPLKARLKVALLMALFFLPVLIAAWNQQLDGWLARDHSFDAASGREILVVNTDFTQR
jgi:hypothetical protein